MMLLRLVLSLMIAVGSWPADAAFPGGFLAVGGGGVTSPPGQLATFTITNDSGSAQSVLQPTQTKFFAFKDGDVCSGAALIWSHGATPLKYSYGLLNFWNSGCLKSGTFMWLPDASIAGSSSNTTITVSCCTTGNVLCKTDGTAGGNWPCPSARTDTEIFNQSCSLGLPRVGGGSPVLTDASYGDGLSAASYGAWLRNDANKFRELVWMDGDAGKAYWFSTHASTSIGGTADSTLVVDWFVQSLNTSAGALGGFRVLPELRQPFYNAAGVASMGWKAFAAPNTGTPSAGTSLTCNGATSAPSFLGGDGNPIQTAAFTVAPANTLPTTNAANNYYYGEGSGSGASCGSGNATPVYFTGGSLPAQLTTSQVYWVRSNQCTGAGGATPAFEINGRGPPQNPNYSPICMAFVDAGGNLINCTIGTGSGTINPLIVVAPWTDVFFADANGHYNFFQGSGGSFTAETTLRNNIARTYQQLTKVFPPWDLSISCTTAGGHVADIGFQSTPGYNPYHIGTYQQVQQNVGEHSDLMWWPNDAATWFYCDSKLDDQIIRYEGLSGGGGAVQDIHDATTDLVPNFINTGASSYTGLSSGVAGSIGKGSSGFPSGASGNEFTSIIYSSTDESHKPNYEIPAYFMTGELQYLLLEMNEATIMFIADVGKENASPNSPGTLTPVHAIYMGFVDEGSGENREQSWAHRDSEYAAGVCPRDPTGTQATFSFGGTQLCKYLNDIADANDQFALDTWNPANNVYGSATTFITTTRHIWAPGPNVSPFMFGGAGVFTYENSYQSKNYGVSAWNVAASIRESSKATTWLSEWISGQAYVLTNFGGFNLYGASDKNAIAVGGNGTNAGLPVIPDDAHWGLRTEGGIWGGGAFLNSNTASPYFTGGIGNVGTSGLQLGNGDIFQFCGSGYGCVPPATATADTPYYVCNYTSLGLVGGAVAEGTFDLSTAPPTGSTCNGSTLTMGSTGAVPAILYYRSVHPLPDNQCVWEGGAFVATGRYAVTKWAKAILGVGNTSLNSLETDIVNRLVNGCGWSPDNGGLDPSDFFGVREAMQNHFGP